MRVGNSFPVFAITLGIASRTILLWMSVDGFLIKLLIRIILPFLSNFYLQDSEGLVIDHFGNTYIDSSNVLLYR